MKIKTIVIGTDEAASYYHTDKSRADSAQLVDEIKEEVKQIGSDTAITVYRCYRDGNLFLEVEAGSKIMLYFEP